MSEVGEATAFAPRGLLWARRPVGWMPDSIVYASCAAAQEELATLKEAMTASPANWGPAIADELQSHIENGTWEKIDQIPPGIHYGQKIKCFSCI